MKFRKMSFILCMMILLFGGITAYAAECNLGISLGEKGAEVELAVYKVSDIQDGEYLWLSEYEGVNVDLTKVSSAAETKEAAEKLYGWITEKSLSASLRGTTDENGSVSFQLDSGVYVIAKESEKGSMAPVLLMLSEGQTEDSLILSPKFSVDDDKDDDDKDDDDDMDDDKEDKKEEDDTEDKDDKNKTTGAKTGDTTNVALWVSVMVAALAGIVIVVKKNHSKR